MRKQHFLCWVTVLFISLLSCSTEQVTDYDDKGSTTVVSVEGPQSAFMGDSITYSFTVAGDKVTLGTSKISILYGNETVFERLVVTGTAGTYTGRVFIPFLKNIPDGEATVSLQVKNIYYAQDKKETEIQVSRPKFPYLILRTEDDQEYRMLPKTNDPFEFAVTDVFPSELHAYLIAPKYGENGNVITFGNSDGKISHGLTQLIEFTADTDGEYEISFNTMTYEGTPFIKFALNDEEFEKVDDSSSKVEMELKKGDLIQITGLKDDYVNYWIDPAFFDIVKDTDRKILKFRGMDAKYRVTVNRSLKYFMVELMNGDVLAQWENGGQGIWVIGDDNIGKPSYQRNNINWTENKAFAMTPLGDGKYQTILQAGTQIKAGSINFKFFGQKGWGYEFTANRVTLGLNSDWLRVNSSDGNIRAGSIEMVNGKYYVVNLDTTETPAILTVVEVDDIPEVNE